VWLTTGEWDATLARESLGIPMANDSAWPETLAEAKVVVDSTTKRLPWAVGMEDSPDINAKIKENFAKLIKGDLNAAQFAAAMAR
jgi:raffinose/stachyose/melibiose transport system substrate-binding protein